MPGNEKGYLLYRCRNCNETFRDEEKNPVDLLIRLLPLSHDLFRVHRCKDDTIGVCDLIGGRDDTV